MDKFFDTVDTIGINHKSKTVKSLIYWNIYKLVRFVYKKIYE